MRVSLDGPWLPGDYGVATHQGKTVYVHVLKVPDGGVVALPNLPTRIVKMANLNGEPVSYRQDEKYTRIKVSPLATDTIDEIIKVELAEPWASNAVVPVEFDRGWFSPQASLGVKQ